MPALKGQLHAYQERSGEQTTLLAFEHGNAEQPNLILFVSGLDEGLCTLESAF
jgi:hypothetical protein